MKREIGRRRLFPAMCAGGRLVHLANRHHQPVCGQYPNVGYRVPGRITCQRCRLKAPRAAVRHDTKPVVIAVDLTPFYTALRRALDGGAVEEPKVKWTHIPIFEGEKLPWLTPAEREAERFRKRALRAPAAP